MIRIITCLFLLITPALIYAESQPSTGDNDHVTRWNKFVDDIHALHKRQIKKYDYRVETRIGGYSGDLKFYKEEKFIDKASGRLLSIIQWEREHPDHIHSIDVYVYDKKGRVKRDYSALYLTFSRNAPQQTLVNLYAYNGDLKAWRQFDASNERIGERCSGTYKGKKVDIEMDDMDILDATDVKDGPFSKPDYKACFRGLPVDGAGKYLMPQ